MSKKGFINVTLSPAVNVALPAKRRPIKSQEEINAKRFLDAARDEANHQTPEQDQHSHYGVKVTQEGKRRAYNVTGSNLDYYLKRNSITAEQWAAGNRLYADFFHSRMVGGFKSCLNIPIGGGNLNKAGMNFQAYESYTAALERLHVRYRKITVEFCCMDKWLESIVSSVPKYRRMDALLRGLDELIRHYDSRIAPRKMAQSMNEHVQPQQ